MTNLPAGVVQVKYGNWDFPTAFSLWGDEEQAAIDRVRASGRYTMHEEVAAFEAAFAEYMGLKHSIMVNSGSSANLVAVVALLNSGRLAYGPEMIQRQVLVPAIAWATTYSPFIQNNIAPRLMDCDGTWCALPDPRLIDNPNICLVVDVPILGNPGYGREWKKIADQHNIPLMVDCCESLGAWMGPYGTRTLAGTTGLVNTFSFFYSHQLSAIEGGMILTDDGEIANLCRMLRNHGLARPPSEAESFDEQYDFRLMGYNLRPLEMHAAIARAQLPKLDTHRRHREQGLNNFINLAQAARLPIEVQAKIWGTVWSPFGIPFTVESKETRTRLVTALRANGIDCRLPTGGSFRKHKYGQPWSNQSTPNADKVHDTGLFLGLAPYPIDELIERAVKVMKETL